ncbi:MAG: hypothetical protein K2H24_05500 [Clostridia bacterium]|nr:hypothetical protein [Clostridia bacterium]
MGKLGILMIKKNYAFGEYFSPRDVLNIARKKSKFINWWLLLIPIRAILLLFNILLSAIIYPIFILNKLFCKIIVPSCNQQNSTNKIALLIIKIAHDIVYIMYRIAMPLLGFCVTVYKICPNRVVYFSNQTTLLFAKDLNEIKARYKISFFENIEKIAQTNQDYYSHSELSDLFEADFFCLVNNTVPQLQDEI